MSGAVTATSARAGEAEKALSFEESMSGEIPSPIGSCEMDIG